CARYSGAATYYFDYW
nr:immunoglobulin heavy chain junction region [Macaca mulatta]MOW80272.1 immunoglobulin heavy chain junction region [Macaca mulatta]